MLIVIIIMMWIRLMFIMIVMEVRIILKNEMKVKGNLHCKDEDYPLSKATSRSRDIISQVT